MDRVSQFHRKAGFLPTVKVKALQNIRNKKQMIQKSSSYKLKLRITDQDRNVPDLIDDYYKRFKAEKHKTQPLSVSINFKQISQGQLQAEVAKYKQSKLRSKSSKNKNRSNSEGSYAHQLKLKKAAETQKIKLTTKALLTRLQGAYQSQIYRMGYFNSEIRIKEELQIKQKSMQVLSNQSESCHNNTIQTSQSLKFVPKGSSLPSKEDFAKRQLSTLCGLAYQKKCRIQSKIIQSLKQPALEPLPSPWKEQVRASYNPEQNEELFEQSIQY